MGASERDEFLRAAWRAEVSEGLEADRFVFVDEMGTNTSLSPLHGRSRVGERLRAKAPRTWGKNVTLISSMSTGGMGPSVAVEWATTRPVFEAYVEQALVPSLRGGQVVVMDNLSAHKGGRIRELIEGRGCELFYLPPYSPDPQSHRRGVLEGEGHLEEGSGPNPQRAHRGHGPCPPSGERFRRTWVLRTQRIPRYGSTVLTNALGTALGLQERLTELVDAPIRREDCCARRGDRWVAVGGAQTSAGHAFEYQLGLRGRTPAQPREPDADVLTYAAL